MRREENENYDGETSAHEGVCFIKSKKNGVLGNPLGLMVSKQGGGKCEIHGDFSGTTADHNLEGLVAHGVE